VIVDHCSLSWGVDETLSTWYAVRDCSLQWCVISEALNCSTHSKGCHSMGALIGGYASDEKKTVPGAHDISFHHNLLAHNGGRNPMIRTSGLVDVVNNIVYDPSRTIRGTISSRGRGPRKNTGSGPSIRRPSGRRSSPRGTS
jgi:pectate lyase